MKLNSAKCAFGLDLETLMGFIVFDRGIEANTKKIKAIMNIKSLKKISETQRLTSKVAALNRFVSKSTDKCLLLFMVLRKVQPWNDYCYEAFQALKQCLSSLPLLSHFKQWDTL